MGRGMQRLCKIYGSIVFKGSGKEVRYVWDYHTDEAILESNMTKERLLLSEKAKWKAVIKPIKNGELPEETEETKRPF